MTRAMDKPSKHDNSQLRLHAPKRFKTVLTVGLILVAAGFVLSLALGSKWLTLQELSDGLFHPQVDSYAANIVRKRVSRTVFSLLCGGALGVSGSLMQAVTRNPIADPSILGVNTGASLSVVCAVAFLGIQSPTQYITAALAGAAVTAVFVYAIGSAGRGGATPIKLVLAGAATSAALSSLVSAVLIPRSFVMDMFRYWQVGSVGSANWSAVLILLPFWVAGMLIAIVCAPALNALALGDEAATGLGVRTGALRVTAAVGGVLLCGAVTALAGPIGFIGLLAPHLMRLVLGPNLRHLIPMSAISGGFILTIADVAGRLLGSPTELEVGVVTAFIGAPALIYIAIKSKVRTL